MTQALGCQVLNQLTGLQQQANKWLETPEAKELFEEVVAAAMQALEDICEQEEEIIP